MTSRVPLPALQVAIRGEAQSLVDTGYKEADAVLSLEVTRREQQDRLLDEMDDYTGKDFSGRLTGSLKAAALEWLCLHLREEDLPEGLELDSRMVNPGISMAPSRPSSNSLAGMSRASSTGSLASGASLASGDTTATTSGSGSSSSKVVVELSKYGWAQNDVQLALKLCRKATGEEIEGEGEEQALLLRVATLLSNATMAATHDTEACSKVVLDPSLSPEGGQQQQEEEDEGVSIEEECDVLESIFTAESFSLATSSNTGIRHLRIDIPADLLATGAVEVPIVHLDVYVHPL